MSAGVIRSFSNIGLMSPSRVFAGFQSSSLPEIRTLGARQATRARLKPGDIVSISAEPGGGDGDGTGALSVGLLAFDASGHQALGALGTEANDILPSSTFDDGALRGWIAAQCDQSGRGRQVSQGLLGGQADLYRGALVPLDDTHVMKAARSCTLWLIHPMAPDRAVAGAPKGTITYAIKRAVSAEIDLPDPLGKMSDEFTVTRGTARAYELAKGDIVQIIDVEGQQCSDFMAFRRDGLERGIEQIIDSTATRSMVRHAYPRPGMLDKFFDAEMRPLLTVIQDTCGRHDTFGLACTARGYEDRGFPGHLNCSDNISEAMAPFGVAPRAAWPAINFFCNTWVDPHSGAILTEESHSRPGDYVAMRAQEDLVCVSTACPDDLDPINGWNPTDVQVRFYRGETPIKRASPTAQRRTRP